MWKICCTRTATPATRMPPAPTAPVMLAARVPPSAAPASVATSARSRCWTSATCPLSAGTAKRSSAASSSTPPASSVRSSSTAAAVATGTTSRPRTSASRPAPTLFQVPGSAVPGSTVAPEWSLPRGSCCWSPRPCPRGEPFPTGLAVMGAAGQGACAGAAAPPGMFTSPGAGMCTHGSTAAPSCTMVPAWRSLTLPWAVSLQYKGRSSDEHVWVLSFLPVQAVPIPLGCPPVLAPGGGCSLQHHMQPQAHPATTLQLPLPLDGLPAPALPSSCRRDLAGS